MYITRVIGTYINTHSIPSYLAWYYIIFTSITVC